MTMLPYMTDNVALKGKSTDVFKGINTSAKAKDGELTRSDNMSARNYPALSVRKGRTKVCDAEGKINGMGVYNKLYYTCSGEDGDCTLHYGDKAVSLGNKFSADTERSFGAIADSILIMPDKKLYKPSDNTVQDLENSQTFTMDEAYERAKQEIGIAGDQPVYYLGELYDDRIEAAYISNGRYTSYYFSLKDLSAEDIVYITMDVHPAYADYDEQYYRYVNAMKEGFFAKITDVVTVKHEILNGGFINSIVGLRFAPGTIDTGGYSEVSITGMKISKKIPDLVHMCTHANRVWATEGNSIRSSALGKPWVWDDYSADTYGTLPSSCYSVEVDSGGEFTAICSFNGSILAFKQNCIHKLYGSQPENYTLYTQSCTGVEPGGGKSLAVINGVLYYKGCDGFYAYSGGVPECISRNLTLEGKAVCSGTDGTNYYSLMSGREGTYILVYYPDKGIWHRESVEGAYYIAGHMPDLFCAVGNSVVNLCSDSSKEVFDWSFELSFDEDTYRYKQYARILVKYRLAGDGYFTVTAEYDDNRHLSHISGNYNSTPKGYSTAQLPSVRCRELRLVFRGRGEFELLDITREYRLLSDEK